MKFSSPTKLQLKGPGGQVVQNPAYTDMDPAQADAMIAAGFSYVPTPGDPIIACATANRPTAGMWPGFEIFDTTLNKPIWRNKLNSGWVDATGSAA
jgi:hypothetical protein